MAQILIEKLNEPVNSTVSVPGSKSITNRALLMAVLCAHKCTLHGVLFSDDSRHFLDCLMQLGFSLDISEEKAEVVIEGTGGVIPKSSAEINVGSAGTGARFLTAMLALSSGEYVINASEQMKRRPMKALFDALGKMGAKFTYLEKEGFLPVKVKGAGSNVSDTADIDISKSTQFLSALMIIAPTLENGLKINITSDKKTGSYVRITSRMMEEFGCKCSYSDGVYTILGGQEYSCFDYLIEPDVSAACYFYGAAAITGGRIVVKNVHLDSMQGDIKFLSVLEKMGCIVSDSSDGVVVCGPAAGTLKGIDVDMNDFSDQALTLAAIAPFADGPVTIRNIGHIRNQESDRINAMVTELRKLGIEVDERDDGVTIHPGVPCGGKVATYEDHRVAMAFSLIGLKVDGIIIEDYECCGKTFERYFEVIDGLK